MAETFNSHIKNVAYAYTKLLRVTVTKTTLQSVLEENPYYPSLLSLSDTFKSFIFKDANGGNHFGMGLGTLVFLVNICLLSAYTFSCHSWRHFVGGGADCYSCSAMNRTRYGLWQKVSFLNERHGQWAMASLISVATSDVVVYLIASGKLHDIRFF